MIVVNTNTRQFSIPGADLVFGVEHDSGSEVKNFQCHRYVGNNVDVANSFVRINYRNANGEMDSYLINDLTVEGENVHFSWSLAPKVTAYKGQVKFVMCVVGPDLKVKWHTAMGTGQVHEGLEPDQSHIEDETDDVVAALIAMVEQQTAAVEAVGKTWVDNTRNEGVSQVAAVKAAAQDAQSASVAEIEAKGVNTRNSIPSDYTALSKVVDDLTRDRAGAIVCEAEGYAVTLRDAGNLPIQGLRVFGKTTQTKTTGTQLANFGDRTDSKGVTSTFINDILSVGCDGSAAYQYARMDITNFVKNNPGKILQLSYKSVTAATILDGSVAQINITLTDGTPRYTTILSRDLEKIAFTIPTDVSAIATAALAIYATNNATPKANRVTIEKPILHFGTTDLPYEPYSNGVASPSPEYPQELVSPEPVLAVAGKNLIPQTTGTISAQGITSSPAIDGTVLLSGTATQEISRVVSQNFLLQPGKYTLSVIGINKIDGNKDRVYLNAADGGGTIVNYVMVDKPVTFEMPSSMIVRAAIVFAPGSAYENRVAGIQLEVGDGATEFEPYKLVQSLEVVRTLRGIPVTTGGNYTDENGQQWICDEVDLERGVYVQRIGHRAFDGTETAWRRGTMPTGEPMNYVYFSDYAVENLNLSLCSHSVFAAGGGYWNNGGYMRSGTGYWQTLTDMALDEWKAYLSEQNANGTPLVVCYVLSKPIETPLSETEIAAYRALHTNKPNTTILNDSGAHMKVEYAADTKLYIDQRIKGALL